VPLRDPEATALNGRWMSQALAALPMKDHAERPRGKGELGSFCLGDRLQWSTLRNGAPIRSAVHQGDVRGNVGGARLQGEAARRKASRGIRAAPPNVRNPSLDCEPEFLGRYFFFLYIETARLAFFGPLGIETRFVSSTGTSFRAHFIGTTGGRCCQQTHGSYRGSSSQPSTK
jgi:hypothetical protein